jgi:rhomboid family GlyGly-CTERM serine protease
MPTLAHTNWFSGCRGTWSLVPPLVLLNMGVFVPGSVTASDVLDLLQFDGRAVRAGELWRLVTANLVHFSLNHFLLDVSVFLVLGTMYEPYFRGRYPWLLLVMGLAGSLGGLLVWPANTICRGLSAVDSGLFAAALFVEFRLAWRDRTRWLWVGPAAALFVWKNIYELTTGHSFFSTESILGPARLAVAAHTAAILAAVGFCTAMVVKETWDSRRLANEPDVPTP